MATSSSEVQLSGLQEVEPEVVGVASAGRGEARQPDITNAGLRHRHYQDDDAGNTWGDDDEDEQVSYAEQEELTAEERNWGLGLCFVCALDIAASGTFVIVAFTHAWRDYGISLYCLAMQAFSHLLSSALLLVRYALELMPLNIRNQDASRSLLLRKKRRKILIREQACSVTMGIVLLISAASLLFKAARKFRFWDKWHLDHAQMDEDVVVTTEWLAWWGFASYTLQALFRCVAGCKLRRGIVWHGFWASVVSLLFLFVLGVAARKEREWSWKAEPIAAAVLAFGTLVEGVRVVLSHFDDMDMRLQHDSRA